MGLRGALPRPPLALVLTACLLGLTAAPAVARSASERTVVLTAPFTDDNTLRGCTPNLSPLCFASADRSTGLMQVQVAGDATAMAGILATHELGSAESLRYRATFDVEVPVATRVSLGMSHSTHNRGGFWFGFDCMHKRGSWMVTRQLVPTDKEVTFEWTVSEPVSGTQYLPACLWAGSGLSLVDATLTRIEAIIGD